MTKDNPLDLLPECYEILESISAVKGESHARMVMTLFSMGNIGTLLLNAIEQNEPIKNQFECVLGQFVFCFVEATMKQNPLWVSMSMQEQDERAQRYLDSLREDVEILERKQKEYCS